MTSTDLLVDVVIPTRNRRDLALGAVSNALTQEGVATRVYLVVDGTEDDTIEAIEKLENPKVEVIVHETSQGPAASRNDGVRKGSAPWVALLDDDDRWAPNKLRRQLEMLEQQRDAIWSATGCVKTDQNMRPFTTWSMAGGSGDMLDRLLVACVIPAGGSSVLMQRELFEKVGGFDTSLHAAEDWDLWLKLAKHSPISYVDEPLVAYRRWDGNASNDLDKMGEHQNEIQERHGGTIDEEAARQQAIGWQQHLARGAIKRGQRGKAAFLYSSVAWKTREPGQLAYAAASLASPKYVVRRLEQVDERGANPDWVDNANSWLRRVPN